MADRLPGDNVRVEANDDCVIIHGHQGVIAHWDREEWVANPSLVPFIASCVAVGMESGEAALRHILCPGSDRRVCSACDELVDLQRRREHLLSHTANAADMTAEEVIDMFTHQEQGGDADNNDAS